VTLEVSPDALPSNYAVMHALEFPLLRTESSVQVGQSNLLPKSPDLQGKKRALPPIDVLCYRTPLWNELFVGFVLCTVLMERNEHLRLMYRVAVGEKQTKS
jgi:hypothetical protein